MRTAKNQLPAYAIGVSEKNGKFFSVTRKRDLWQFRATSFFLLFTAWPQGDDRELQIGWEKGSEYGWVSESSVQRGKKELCFLSWDKDAVDPQKTQCKENWEKGKED